jgi:hypothetical protein
MNRACPEGAKRAHGNMGRTRRRLLFRGDGPERCKHFTVAGPRSEICWLVRHENASSIEAAIGAPMGSEKCLAEVEGGGEFFMSGATQIYAQRFASDRLLRAPHFGPSRAPDNPAEWHIG